MAERVHLEGLPLFTAGHAAAQLRLEAGPEFWPAIERLAAGDALASQLDDLLAGGASPRTWLVLHEPGEPQLSAAAALLLARALVGRGQNVLVLDVDEGEAALTRWVGREETEGWIDVARFGASVLGAGLALPFRGGRGALLGIGSFRPTDASEGEIISLVGRLRHQADDIVLVGAVGPAVVPWARLATRRVLCWDPDVRAADQLPRVSRLFDASGVPLTGLVGFGDAAAVKPAVDVVGVVEAVDAVDVASVAGAVGAVVGPDVPEAAVADDIAVDDIAADDIAADQDAVEEDAVEEDVADEDVADEDAADEDAAHEDAADGDDTGRLDDVDNLDAPSSVDEPVTVGVAAAAAGPAPATVSATVSAAPPVPGRDADLGLGAEGETQRGNPRVFWLATGVFAVALLAVAWYWSEYVRVPPGGYFSPVVTREDSSGVAGAHPDAVAQPQVAAAGGQMSSDDSLSELRRAGEAGTTPASAPVNVPAATNAATNVATTAGPANQPPTSAPAAREAARPAVTPPARPEAATFDRAAYEVPAGEAGWALHVYSVPDSAGAVRECAGLERAGFRTAVRIVEIKEKGGRWWRIYVGSFPTRKAAEAAMPALLEKLKADWAEPASMK